MIVKNTDTVNVRGSIIYRDNTIVYSNKEKGENDFMKRKFPFNDIYWQIINHLKKLGYSVGYSSYYDTNFTCLKKDHYRADKGDVCLLFSRYPAGFKIEINNVKNHMITSDSFWSNWNDKYLPLSYLEQKRIELAIKHVRYFINNTFYHSLNVSSGEPKDPIQRLFYSEKINKHIHGGAQTWAELKKDVDENEPECNCKDKHGNKLVCGQTKYFYSHHHGNRLCRAEVWHHINNMWWAIVNGETFNTASFRLFDYDSSLPQKDPEKAIPRVEKLIQHYQSEMNFEKCIPLRNKLNQLNLL